MNRAEKSEEVAKLKAELGDIRHAFVIDYKGVTVPQVSALRRQVRKLGAEYRVLKNTLLRRAVEGAPLHALSGQFTGPTALAWHRDDPVQLAKALRAFATATPAVSFRCALVDGELVSAERIEDVANLPGLDVLKGRLVYLLASPMSRFVTVLSAPSRGLASVLKQHADKQS